MADTTVMTVMEIIQALRQININLTSDQQLLNPEGETIEAIYVQCLKHCLQLKQEDLAKMSQRGLTYLSQETDLQAASRLGLLFNLNKLMRLVGIDDFSFMDVMRPDAKRTRRILSSICKFALFQAREQEYFRDTLAQNAQQEAFNAQLKAECDKAQEELERVRDKKQKELPHFQRLSAQLAEKSAHLDDLLAQKQKQLEAKDSAEQALRAAENGCAVADATLSQLEQHIERLREKIVKSPTKIMQKYEALEQEIARERDDLNALEKDIKLAHFKKECLHTFAKEFTELCIEPSDQLKAERAKHADVSDRVAKLRAQNQEYEDSYNTLLSEISDLESKKYEVEKQLQKLQEEQNEISGKRLKTNKELQDEKRTLENDIAYLKSSTKQIHDMIKALEGELQKINDEAALKAAKYAEQQKEIKEAIMKYQESIVRQIQNQDQFYPLQNQQL